jgi:hypothetical protein
VSLCTVAVLEERAWELLVTAEEELLLEREERACEPLLTEELPDERVVTLLERVVVPLEREVEVPLERVVLVPEDRVALLPPERELLPVERLTCWLLPEERVLELERLLEELLPLERVVVVPPPEREERD